MHKFEIPNEVTADFGGIVARSPLASTLGSRTQDSNSGDGVARQLTLRAAADRPFSTPSHELRQQVSSDFSVPQVSPAVLPTVRSLHIVTFAEFVFVYNIFFSLFKIQMSLSNLKMQFRFNKKK